MLLQLSWEQIAIRLALACISSFVIGLNRDERGHPAGVRTTMLVCLAATLTMLQVNLLLTTSGKAPNSFVSLDLMRLPLGILSGIGFIGAGVIIKDGTHVSGVTTAATIWLVTVLGLLFGGGTLWLGVVGSLLAFFILRVLKLMERHLSREYRGSLHLDLLADAPSEVDLRGRLLAGNCAIDHWSALYEPAAVLVAVDCELKWTTGASRVPGMPSFLEQLRSVPGIRTVSWKE